jgi:von Willebrand factor type A domain/Aerotolerance regulator N-terminal
MKKNSFDVFSVFFSVSSVTLWLVLLLDDCSLFVSLRASGTIVSTARSFTHGPPVPAMPTFIHSWMFFAAFPVIFIPLILHLLTLHRLKTVELPTFRFLFDSYIQQRRRMQFLEALLAVLRMLFLLFLIGLISRPVVDHWNSLFGGTGGGREVILLIDCSASMNAKTGGLSAFERAKSVARTMIAQLGSNDRLTLVRVAAAPEEVFSRFTTDTRGIQERIDALQPTSSRANLFAALLHLFGSEATRRDNPVVYLLTDCQSNSWKEARNQGLEKLLPAGLPFTVVDVGTSDNTSNRAVVGNAPRRNRVIAGLPVVLTANIVNHGKEQADVTVILSIDDKEVARQTVAMEPGKSTTREFVYRPTEPGVRRGRFEIANKTLDHFPDDDRFLFTLNVEPRVRVVLVNGGPNADPLQNEAAYLLTALTSRAETVADDKPRGDQLPAQKEILKSLDVKEIPEVALTPEVLADASVVILANCGALNDDQFNRLRGFVRDGGGLLIFPGDHVPPTRYNQGLFPVPGPQGERLTPIELGTFVGDPDKSETFATILPDTEHPVLTVFKNNDANAAHFKTTRIYRHFPLEQKAKGGWRLFKFGDDKPAMVESRFGDGVVIVSAFPAHPRWANLPLKPDFVPLMLRLVSYAEHQPDVAVPAVVVADSPAEIRVSKMWEPAEAVVRLEPAGPPTTVALERAGSRLLGSFERTGARGYYTVEAHSLRPGNPKTVSQAFAVNLAPEESDFSRIGSDEIRKLLPREVKFTYVNASAEEQSLHGSIGKQTEVWPYLIWAVFIVIGVEFLLSTISGRRPSGEQGPGVGERVLEVSTGAWVGKMTGA